MKLVFPKYKEFKCLAANCPMNCCKNYRILFFKWEANQFGTKDDWNNIDGQGNDIRQFLERNDDGWSCKLCNGACVFLDRKRDLCNIQLRHGQGSLPSVCRTYPRIITRYPDRTEYALDPCCPVVAEFIFDWKIGDILIEGGKEWHPSDKKSEMRQKMMDLLANPGNSLEFCLGQMKEAYSVDDEVPQVGLEGKKLEYGRKFLAFLLWSYLIPYEGIGTIDNIMTQIFDMIRCYFNHLRDIDMSDDSEMSYDLARFMNDYVVRMEFDTEIEGRYIDIEDE